MHDRAHLWYYESSLGLAHFSVVLPWARGTVGICRQIGAVQTLSSHQNHLQVFVEPIPALGARAQSQHLSRVRLESSC